MNSGSKNVSRLPLYESIDREEQSEGAREVSLSLGAQTEDSVLLEYSWNID